MTVDREVVRCWLSYNQLLLLNYRYWDQIAVDDDGNTEYPAGPDAQRVPLLELIEMREREDGTRVRGTTLITQPFTSKLMVGSTWISRASLLICPDPNNPEYLEISGNLNAGAHYREVRLHTTRREFDAATQNAGELYRLLRRVMALALGVESISNAEDLAKAGQTETDWYLQDVASSNRAPDDSDSGIAPRQNPFGQLWTYATMMKQVIVGQ